MGDGPLYNINQKLSQMSKLKKSKDSASKVISLTRWSKLKRWLTKIYDVSSYKIDTKVDWKTTKLLINMKK
jgi:hypothetical protein